MIRIEFNPDEIKALDYERYEHPHPKIQKKMEALYLKSKGLPHKEICRLCGVSRGTLATYLKQYKEGGISGLKKLGYEGKPNELMKHSTSLEQYFKENPPSNTASAQAAIEKLTGIKRSPTQVREFMKRLGLRCRKVGFVPGKTDNPDKINEQERFKEDELGPRLQEAKNGQRAVFFC